MIPTRLGRYEAVSEWRFEPATRGDRPLPVRYVVRQHFRLES